MTLLSALVPTFIKNWLCNPVIKAKLMKWLRWASQGAGTFVLVNTYQYLHLHVTSLPDSNAATIAGVLSAAAGGLILSVGSALYSMIDADTVDAKINIVALTGSVHAANSNTLIKEVKAATKQISAPSGTPEALAQLKDVLVTGQS